MNTLDKICMDKAEHVARMRDRTPLSALEARIKDKSLPIGFVSAIKRQTSPALIAEVKKASPSKGLIRADFNPSKIAQIYEECGATCISVLTDEPYFQGKDSYLLDVKKAVDIPVLRKDFMIDPYQIYESRALGADCILLIMAALDDELALELYETALSLNLDVLVEVHNLEELERANKLDPMMIGVNNRNLKTLEVDVQTSFDLLMKIPDTAVKIAESGIADHDTLSRLYSCGYNGFLVGESLMREEDIAKAVKTLLGK